MNGNSDSDKTGLERLNQIPFIEGDSPISPLPPATFIPPTVTREVKRDWSVEQPEKPSGGCEGLEPSQPNEKSITNTGVHLVREPTPYRDPIYKTELDRHQVVVNRRVSLFRRLFGGTRFYRFMKRLVEPWWN